MKYSKQGLLKKFKGLYIDTLPIYDCKKRVWLYMMRKVSRKKKANFRLPEDCIVRKVGAK